MSYKKLSEYLPYYLGCRCKYKHQEKKGLINIHEGVGMWRLIAIHYTEGKVNLEAKGCIEVVSMKDVTPILSKLEDITEEDIKAVGFEAHQMLRNEQGDRVIPAKEKGFVWAAKQTHYLLSKHYDLFGLIESGLAIDKKTLS